MTEDSTSSKWTRPVVLTVCGVILVFLGFVFPGLIWCLKTPGDTEMITLITAGVVGAIGVVILLFVLATFISVILVSKSCSKLGRKGHKREDF